MKFRTDFVTNSSSSSFCSVTVTTRDGEDISYSTEDQLGELPENSERMQCSTTEELISYLYRAVVDAEADDFNCDWDNDWKRFAQEVNDAGGIDAIRAVEIDYREIDYGEFADFEDDDSDGLDVDEPIEVATHCKVDLTIKKNPKWHCETERENL